MKLVSLKHFGLISFKKVSISTILLVGRIEFFHSLIFLHAIFPEVQFCYSGVQIILGELKNLQNSAFDFPLTEMSLQFFLEKDLAKRGHCFCSLVKEGDCPKKSTITFSVDQPQKSISYVANFCLDFYVGVTICNFFVWGLPKGVIVYFVPSLGFLAVGKSQNCHTLVESSRYRIAVFKRFGLTSSVIFRIIIVSFVEEYSIQQASRIAIVSGFR